MKSILCFTLVVVLAVLNSCSAVKKHIANNSSDAETPDTELQYSASDFLDYGPESIYCDSLDDLKAKYSSDGESSPCDETIINLAERLNTSLSEDYRCSFVYERWTESFTSPKIGTDVTLKASWKSEGETNNAYSLTVQYHEDANNVKSYINDCKELEKGKLYVDENEYTSEYYYLLSDNYLCMFSVSNRDVDEAVREEEVAKYIDISKDICGIVNG